MIARKESGHPEASALSAPQAGGEASELSTLKVAYFYAKSMLSANASVQEVADAIGNWNAVGCIIYADVFFAGGLVPSTTNLEKLNATYIGHFQLAVPRESRLQDGFYVGPVVVSYDSARIVPTDIGLLTLSGGRPLGIIRRSFGAQTATTLCMHLQKPPNHGVLPCDFQIRTVLFEKVLRIMRNEAAELAVAGSQFYIDRTGLLGLLGQTERDFALDGVDALSLFCVHRNSPESTPPNFALKREHLRKYVQRRASWLQEQMRNDRIRRPYRDRSK